MSYKKRDKWIVFDAMGVIFKVGDDTGRLLIPMIMNLNPSLSAKHIHSVYVEASLGTISAFEFWKQLGFANNYPKIQQAYLEKYLKLDEGFKKAAKNLSKTYNLAMLSNDVGEWSNYLRKIHELDMFFKDVIISSNVGLRKPSKEIYEILLKRTGAEPQNCTLIDDSNKNLEAAKRLGINVILFNRDINKQNGNQIICSFDELEEKLHKTSK